MKMKTQSSHMLHIRQLLGLALIGIVLWLAAIGWLPVASAKAAPGAPKPSFQADVPLKPINDTRQTQIDAC